MKARRLMKARFIGDNRSSSAINQWNTTQLSQTCRPPITTSNIVVCTALFCRATHKDDDVRLSVYRAVRSARPRDAGWAKIVSLVIVAATLSTAN